MKLTQLRYALCGEYCELKNFILNQGRTQNLYLIRNITTEIGSPQKMEVQNGYK